MAAVYICIYPSGYTLTGAEQAKFDVSHRYTSMSSMEAGEDINWVSITSNPFIIILGGDVTNNWATAGPDTSAVLLSGWTLSATYQFFLTAEGTARSEAVWDTDAYIISVSGDEAIHVSSATFVGQFEGFQIEGDGVDADIIFWVRWVTICEIKNCWFRDASSASRVECYQYFLSPPAILRIFNCVFDGTPVICCVNRLNSSYIYHNTMTTATNYCLRAYDGTTQYIENNVLFNNADDWLGTTGFTTRDYNASDDVEGTNAVDISPGATEADEWNKAFTDYSNGDYTVKDTDSVLYDAGKDLSSQFTDTLGDTDPLKYDKLGNDRSSTWDIGAFVFVAGGTIYDMSATGQAGIDGEADLFSIGVMSGVGQAGSEGIADLFSLSGMAGSGEAGVEGSGLIIGVFGISANGEVGIDGKANLSTSRILIAFPLSGIILLTNNLTGVIRNTGKLTGTIQ